MRRVVEFQSRSLFHPARSQGTRRPGPDTVQQSITGGHEVHLVKKAEIKAIAEQFEFLRGFSSKKTGKDGENWCLARVRLLQTNYMSWDLFSDRVPV